MMAQKRRNFLKNTLLGGSLLSFSWSALAGKNAMEKKYQRLIDGTPQNAKSVMGLQVDPIKQVRLGFIGIGSRGMGHLKLATALVPEKATIVAVCDIRPERVKEAADYLQKERKLKVDTYSGEEESWKEMVARDDLDLVIISTPWEDHAPMSIYSMRQGKHVAVEVPAAYKTDELWEMVDTAEEMRRNCMMMENVCYGDEELWVLQMVQEGVFGTLTYGEAAYIHNLRESLFNRYYDHWRIKHYIHRTGNLYPTHGLGPVAQYMDINRGDRFAHLVSMSSKEASLSEASRELSEGHPYKNIDQIAHGDMNSSLIKTELGRTILVQHDVVTPRPYSRINALAGTKAYHEGYPSRLSINGKGHEWLDQEAYEEYRRQYRHPVWDTLKAEIEKYGGHGGMDFVQMYRLIDCFNKGLPLDMDVYDGVAWSAVTPLSAISVELGNIPVKFPDFTRGKWQRQRKLGILNL